VPLPPFSSSAPQNPEDFFRVALPWELLYADDLAVIAETEEELIKRLNEWKDNVESKRHESQYE